MTEFIGTRVEEDEDGAVSCVLGDIEAFDERESYPAFCRVC